LTAEPEKPKQNSELSIRDSEQVTQSKPENLETASKRQMAESGPLGVQISEGEEAKRKLTPVESDVRKGDDDGIKRNPDGSICEDCN
jgi:hypothetical protein